MNNVKNKKQKKILWTVIYDFCLLAVTLKAGWLLLWFLTPSKSNLLHELERPSSVSHILRFTVTLLLWRHSRLLSPSVSLPTCFRSVRSVQEKAKCLGGLNGTGHGASRRACKCWGLAVSSDALNLNERCIFNRYLVTELFK